MNILLAFPDRDLLSVYRELLGERCPDAGCVFDGVQLVSLLGEREFDLVVFDELLPRISRPALIRAVRRQGIPSLMLTRTQPSLSDLLSPDIPDGMLVYPFSPESFFGEIDRVLSSFSLCGTFSLPGGEVRLEHGVLQSRVRLCEDEIGLLLRLSGGKDVPEEENVFLSSLLEKLRRAGIPLPDVSRGPSWELKG